MAWNIERPLNQDRQTVMDQLDAHPIGPHPSLKKETIIDNPLLRRAGFTSLLCDWIARTSWYAPIQIYAIGVFSAMLMERRVSSMGGNLNNCAFIGGSYQSQEPLVGIGLCMSITWKTEEVEFEDRTETVGHERVTLITFSKPIELESRLD
jgi:hypothetical protein